MARVVFSRRWLGRHVLVGTALVVLALLGWWQWTRAQSPTGTFQNLGYALEWWAFGGFAIYGWWRALRDEIHAAAATDPDAEPVDRSLPPVLAQRRPPLPPPTPEEDAALAEYNDYLAWLHDRDRQRASSGR